MIDDDDDDDGCTKGSNHRLQKEKVAEPKRS